MIQFVFDVVVCYIVFLCLFVVLMMDWMDCYCWYFYWLLVLGVWLYIEMVYVNVVIYGDCECLLGFDGSEYLLVLQFGGSDLVLLVQVVCIVQEWGYDEVNFNCGCLFDCVQVGCFGVCLMCELMLVVECVVVMVVVVDILVMVKCWFGVDEDNDYEIFCNFVDQLVNVGSVMFIVYVCNVWLKGLLLKENCEVLLFCYEWVYCLKVEWLQLVIVFNGGLVMVEVVQVQLFVLDGVMLGWVVYYDFYVLYWLEVVQIGVLLQFCEILLCGMWLYIEVWLVDGLVFKYIICYLFGLFYGQLGGCVFCQIFSEGVYCVGVDWCLIEQVLVVIWVQVECVVV